MPVTENYLHYVLEQLAGVGHLSSRRMFSGIGLYADELFFALIFGDTLYFKVDDTNRPDYQARGMSQFRPRAQDSHVSLNYFEVPADILEDDEQLAAWARKSVLVASAAALSKSRPRADKGGRGAGKGGRRAGVRGKRAREAGSEAKAGGAAKVGVKAKATPLAKVGVRKSSKAKPPAAKRK